MAHIRARKVITRGPIRVVGKFPSLKSGRMLHWESQLERDRFRALEFDPDVKSFREQPFTLELDIGGGRCRYTPDIEVVRRKRIVVEEVKPATRLHEYEDVFAAAASALAAEGRHFEVHTEESIRQGAYIENITFLLGCRHMALGPADVELASELIPGGRKIKLCEIFDAFSRRGAAAWMVWALMSRHVLITDYVQPISQTSAVWFNEGGLSCLQ